MVIILLVNCGVARFCTF